MKLRLHGASLRLRLSQGEVARLAAGERLEQRLAIGGGRLVYTVDTVAGDEPARVRLNLPHGRAEIEVLLSRRQVEAWAASTEVGIYGEQPSPAGEALSIAIEKDFRCLASRPEGEDPPDAYPHPRAGEERC